MICVHFFQMKVILELAGLYGKSFGFWEKKGDEDPKYLWWLAMRKVNCFLTIVDRWRLVIMSVIRLTVCSTFASARPVPAL